MLRMIRTLLALACLLAGIVVGALNPQVVRLDLGVVQWPGPLGVVVLLALLAGALAGGLAVAASLPRLRRPRTRATAGNADANANANEP